MSLSFEPIRIDRQNDYQKRLSLCPAITSDYSFVNLWSWAEEHGLFWAWTDQLVWIKQTRPREVHWAPVGPWNDVNWNIMFQQAFTDKIKMPLFVRVPEMLLDLWKEHIAAGLIIEDSRGQWDYLYDIHELAALKGKRFHKKKNLLNQFVKKHQHRFVPLQSDLIDRVIQMQEAWCVWRDCESVDALSHENRAIQRLLDHWHHLPGLVGGAILIEKQIAAYTIAERLDEKTLLVHFEKGDQNYKGIYQAINRMFLQDVLSNPLFQKIRVVNREQDLDDEGLRKAKLSYHPIDFMKKYQVQVGV